MMKRFLSLVLVMMTAVAVFAGGPPGGDTGAEAADETSPQQIQKTGSPAEVQHPVITLSEKWQGRMEKIGQKLEQKQQKSSVKDGQKASNIPGNVRTFLIVGVALILIGFLLMLLPGLGALGSLCSGVGVILCIIALLIYLINYA